jgi:hypothetical protein
MLKQLLAQFNGKLHEVKKNLAGVCGAGAENCY